MTRMTAREYLTVAHPPKRSKYGAKAAFRCRACGCEVIAGDDGPLPCRACRASDPIRFDSGAEAKRYDFLKQEEAFGFISHLCRQVPYPIHWNGIFITTWIADFEYSRGDIPVTEDVKGVKTAAYRIKRKLVQAQYGITITEVAA